MNNKVCTHHSVFSPLLYSLVIQTNYAAGMLTILDMFGFPKFANAFREVGVHEVWNLLSLYLDIHKQFDDLDVQKH